ncbi:hypothetical protein [Novosphingobium pentaromativorans]|uniref:hypothetical protein n=1 Tax=Novosphingobium pentaromativorans TaxID=205844 RepID=UPI000A5A2864|nr:hypothetical protein [Novosphingobium pentaromativorans]
MKAPQSQNEVALEAKATCGIIMPIAAMLPKYEASHWVDVRRVIDVAIEKAGMVPQIVSDSFEGDVIQRRIISNLYENPVVVCDVSGLNPNVMFELGMRITFKQPVVIITDDYATIPFDTKVIEHIGYPRDLHIHQTNEFIDKLADRINRLHNQKEEGKFRSFIEEFGTFEVLEPTKKIVDSEKFILDEIKELNRAVRSLSNVKPSHRSIANLINGQSGNRAGVLDIELRRDIDNSDVDHILEFLGTHFKSNPVEIRGGSQGQKTIRVILGESSEDRMNLIQKQLISSLPDELTRKIHSVLYSN